MARMSSRTRPSPARSSSAKAGLGVYLDCLRARPGLADALQAQADMALRQACQDDDLKW
jgi:hypothetical protein